MKTSVKFLYTSLLLCLALVVTCFTATGTIQAYQHFQQDHQRIQAGDVTTVSAWMTIPYVSRVYRVPEICFTQALHLNDYWLVEHATLRVIADSSRRPLQRLIRDIQDVIITYRRKQLYCGPSPKTIKTTGAPAPPSAIRKGEIR